MTEARTRSLRFRFALASLLWVGISTIVAGLVISGLYRRHVTHTFTSDLQNHMDELVSLASAGQRGTIRLDHPLSDPRFEDRRSGFYWQIQQGGRPVLLSGSLAGARLRSAGGTAGMAPAWTRDLDERLLRIDRAGSGGLVFSITGSGRTLERELAAFRLDLSLSLLAFAALMLLGATLQVSYGLRPARRLGGWIEELRRGERTRLPEDVTAEFAGIVGRLNELLEAQQALIARARLEAGNLGHNLRTPLALVTGEAEQLAAAGSGEAAAFILEQAQRMQRQIDYHMRRAAAAGARGSGIVPDLATFVAPIAYALDRLHAERALALDLAIPSGLKVSCDPGDLSEIVSNLIDNACKWARSRLCVEAWAEERHVVVEVRDDGPGIPESRLTDALDVGGRLDDATPGSGLGLPLTRDLVTLYGGELTLRSPDRQGLVVRVSLPC